MRLFFSWITVIVFVGFIATPPILSLVTPAAKVSKFEKRLLAEFPPLPRTGAQLQTFTQQFEKYYNDHFGLRDFLVESNHLFSYKVFNVSSSGLVTPGTDGWLFFSEPLWSYIGQISLPDEILKSSRQELKDRRDWLAGMGIKYLFMPVPNKWNIYSEYLPWRIQRLAGVTVYDQILPFLENKPDFTEYIDLQRVFLTEKSDGQLYLKTDTHWNVDGAFTAYQVMLDKLEQQQVSVRRLEPTDVVETDVQFSGDLAIIMHLAGYIKEIAPQLETVKKCRQNQAPGSRKKELAARFKKFAKDERKFVMIQGCPENDTSILFIHDSFGLFLHPLLAKTFGTFFYVNRGIEDIQDFIEWVQPDLVIDERIERNLLKLLTPNPTIAKAAMEVNFNRSRNVKFRVDESHSLVGKTRDVVVRAEKKGLRIQSVGDNSSLLFTYDSGMENSPLVARIQLTSPEDSHWFLWYTISEKKLTGAQQGVNISIKKGFNEFYVRLPYLKGKGTLQFHSDSVSGWYLLHSFIIKREPI